MNEFLTFLKDVASQPALLIGLMSFIGLLALKSPVNKLITGTLKPIAGFIMLGVGADFIVKQLDPLGKMIEAGWQIRGVIPNNEAVVSVAQKILGVETMSILLLGFVLNLAIARLTKYKYVFLTGHHSFFLACLLSAVLQATGLEGTELVILGGFILGSWSAISPAIGQKYTNEVTDNGGIAMGHFGSLGYYLSAFIARRVGDKSNSFAEDEISEKWGFLRDTTVTTAILMTVIYLICSLKAGSVYMAEITAQNMILWSFMSGMSFAVGVAIVYGGVRLILADLVPAFQGISDKIIPNAIPAVDCAVFFPYSPTAVVVGFLASFAGGIIGMFTLGFAGLTLIIPGLVPHFFCGATSGIYGDKIGGKRGCVIGAFVNGLLLAFLPALLLPVLGSLNFEATTFSDIDFTVLGMIIGYPANHIGSNAVYVVATVMAIALIIPSFMKSVSIVGNKEFSSNKEL